MIPVPWHRRPSTWVFVFTCLFATGFALYTNHVWEDFYITYRSSKHLAAGDGLVYNLGERVHTFTSPLGVLLPAAASLLTGNSSDAAALWIFRAMAIASLGIAVTVCFITTRRLDYPGLASGFLVACLVTDAKTLDFTINGQEMPFLLAFFGYAFWATFAGGPRRWRHLGLAWAGLMWTRPDAFVTIALFTAGVWLFNRPERTGLTRRAWLPVGLRAAGVAAAVYLPWFAGAWAYYGSPVPHTIVAKAVQAGPKDLAGFLHSVAQFPSLLTSPGYAIHAVFNPVYAIFGGWPEAPGLAAAAVATLAAVLRLVWPLRMEVKALSFTFFGLCLYLNYFPPFVSAWYLSLPSTIALLALAGALAQLLDAARASRVGRAALMLPAGAFLGLAGWFTVEMARELRAQQAIVETGGRRVIGEWLRANAAPGDTVFLEPLGYIGFYSGLRMYDYPGLSSPEVVRAIQRVGGEYGLLVGELQPRWLVLRGHEATKMQQRVPGVFNQYRFVRAFDRQADILPLKIHGKEYLMYDSAFFIFRRRE